MIFKIIHLKDFYPELNRNGADPTLEIMVHDCVRPEYKEKFLRPSVLICPGCGYVQTWIGEGQAVGFEYMAAGCNCFVLHYSVAPHTYPQQLIEVACAVDYIKKNADEYVCDSDRTAILGFSAGGHVAASYCTLRNDKAVTDIVPNPPSVQAAILCYPVITAEEPTHMCSFKALTGKQELSDEDVEHFSLEKHVDPAVTPETFIWLASDDNAVNPLNSLKYASALTLNKIPYELHVFPKGGHGITTCRYGLVSNPESEIVKYDSEWCALSVKWLKSVLKF